MPVTALAVATAALLPLAAAAALQSPHPPVLAWALLVSGSSDPADLRHPAAAAALALALATRTPTLRLFLAHTPAALADLPRAATALVGAPALPYPPPIAAVGPDVTPSLLLATLGGAHPPWHPPTWRLPPTPAAASSTGLLFLTGHGGPGFLRLGGVSLTSRALRKGLKAALARGAAARILLIADTCRAASLAPPPSSLPLLTTLASAAAHQPSYSGGWWTGGGPGGWAGAAAERFSAALVAALLEEEEEEGVGGETLTSLLARPAFSHAALLSDTAIIGDGTWRVADFLGTRAGGAASA